MWGLYLMRRPGARAAGTQKHEAGTATRQWAPRRCRTCLLASGQSVRGTSKYLLGGTEASCVTSAPLCQRLRREAGEWAERLGSGAWQAEAERARGQQARCGQARGRQRVS